MRKLTAAIPLAAAALAGCGSTRGAGVQATASAPPAVAASTSAAAAVGAVPGSDGNEYKAGPFDVRLVQGITRLPSRYDAVTESGQDIPEYGSVVVVKNISRSFTGWVAPEIEYVKGHSIKGEVVDTETADPTAGSGGGQSDTLAPGQSETLYAQYQGSYRDGYVDAQLIQVQYGAAGTGSMDATRVQLKY